MNLNERTTTDTYERALMEAVAGVADMAARVRRNGPERHYAAEKLSRALSKAAEALAIVGAERQIVLEEPTGASSAGCGWRCRTDDQAAGRSGAWWPRS